MKYLSLLLLALTFIACDNPSDDEPGKYNCVEITEENYVKGGCKIGDWHNTDLKRCNSSEAKCQD